MPWMKLTSKALYLMDGDKFLSKVDLRVHNRLTERALDIPVGWFGASDAPGAVVIALKRTIEPTPMPSPPTPYFDLSAIPSPWQATAKPHVPTLVKAFQDQNIRLLQK
jgi:hypothetical protein